MPAILAIAALLLLAMLLPVRTLAEEQRGQSDPQGQPQEEPQDQAQVEVTWTFIKTDELGNPIGGARVELRDANGGVIETFEPSADGLELTETLTMGETYILREVSAPAGYALAQDLTFVVQPDENGDPCIVEQAQGGGPKDSSLTIMVDVPFAPLVVGKRDAGDQPLTGARLTLRDLTADAEVETWASTEEGHEIAAGKLFAGHRYRLSEEEAPEGYEPCKPVEFDLDQSGNVSGVEGTDVSYDKETRMFLLTDAKAPEPEEPEEPTEPETPETPEDPEEPEEPVEPEEPEEPAEPVEPEEPVTPKESVTPEEPVAPQASAVPQQAQTAATSPVATPATASAPATPAASATQAASLPQTGDSLTSVLPIALVGIGAVAAGVVMVLRRR